MVKEAEKLLEKMEQNKEPGLMESEPENVANLENDEILKMALAKMNEKKYPLILWDKKDEGKDYLFQILSREGNVIHAFLIKNDGKKVEVDFQIKPMALSGQIMKLGICENDIFRIRYMGLKKQNKDSEFEFKSFIVWKFDRVTQIFHTTNH